MATWIACLPSSPTARWSRACKEVANKRVSPSGGCAGTTALPKEPAALSLFDEGASFVDGNPGRDGTQDEIDGVQQRRPHEELLEIRW